MAISRRGPVPFDAAKKRYRGTWHFDTCRGQLQGAIGLDLIKPTTLALRT